MRYRGFEITSTIDRGIIRHNYETGKEEICSGYYCQIYPAGDDIYANQLDDFCLAEKYDISDLTERSLNDAIIGYVDGWYEDLVAEKNDVKSNRIYDLLGRTLAWMNETEPEEAFYVTLSEVIGMTDDEIREMGFTSLARYFDRDSYAQTIAEYIIDEGTADTMSGNIHIPFSEINEHFGISLPSDTDMLEKIRDHLLNYSEIVSDLEVEEDFDLMFFTSYCPNYNDEDTFSEIRVQSM